VNLFGFYSKNMKTVLILSRGLRVAPIHAAMARVLAPDYKIVAVLGYYHLDKFEHQAHLWRDIPNLTVYDLVSETKLRAQKPRGEKDISAIEADLDLNLYRAASNYLLYRRQANEYLRKWDGFYGSEQEITEQFVGSYDLLSEIFREHRPHVAFCETPDLIPHRVAQAIGRRHGIFTLGNAFNNLWGDGFAFFVYGSNKRDVLLDHFYRHPGEISGASWRAADELSAKLANDEAHDANYVKFYKDNFRFLTRASRRWSELLRPRNFVRTGALLGYERNRMWLNKVMSRTIPEEPYIFFPLHHQPEASTCLAAPRWVDQDRIAERLAINAPAGVKIVVKENPKTFGRRGRSYFGPLRDLPNICLIHPEVSNDTLLRNAAVILAINGTAGMEGIAMGKRVAILGRPAYDIYSGVRALDFPEEIFSHLADTHWQPESMTDERRTFLAAMAESNFFFGVPKPGGPWPEAGEGGRNYATALRKFMRVIEQHSISPDSVSAAL
jgi:hypothetical protein